MSRVELINKSHDHIEVEDCLAGPRFTTFLRVSGDGQVI